MENILKEILIDHIKSPKNSGELDKPTLSVNSSNPVCGDVVKIDLIIENDLITKVGTNGQGCAVSQASMSIFSEEIDGETTTNVVKKIQEFKNLFNANDKIEPELLTEQSKLLKFLDTNPSKVRCAMLSWIALDDALSES